ncbi:MAG: M1 family metallopeptidase [Actinomycetes bacterium]
MTSSQIDSPSDRSQLDPFRLPRHIIPRRYDLTLEPHLSDATFDGQAIITVDVLATTRFIVLNSIELDIKSVFVDGQPAPFSLDEESERLFIGLIEELPPGTAMIDIVFAGILNDKLRGFYRSTYVDEQGKQQVVATTQMQSTDCRRAFPCFDEPNFKAVFATTLIASPDHLAISNGPEISRIAITREQDHKVAVTFADTMPMSTYLVAFVVGKLEATEPVDVDGVPLRIVHTPGKSHLTSFGLDVGAKSLRWFVNYYGIPYPDAKIDMVALPDFAAGAMENVGCITYRESLLLVDPKTSTQADQQNVADVVSHELAHMWFGDLVTMKWWNGIWLNEAFATFMEVAAVDSFRTEWQRWTSFSLERSAAFEVDSLLNTRSVEFEVRSAQDCEGMFDVLTYQKGGSLLRMLEQYLGTERFRDGIRLYLKTHSYGNTETSDLWDAIETAVSNNGGEPVRELMDSWIWQPGYPLIVANLDATKTNLILQQQRFSFTPELLTDAQHWLVPVHIRINGIETKYLLSDQALEIPVVKDNAAIVVNAGGFGYYRVTYSPELLSRLRGSELAKLAVIERYSLVDDAWNAVVAGRLAAIDFVSFASGFNDERDLAVWQAIAVGLRGCGRLLDESNYPKLQQRIRTLVAPVIADLGWQAQPGEDDLRAKLRGLLVTLLAVSGNDLDAQEKCRELLALHDQQTDSVHPELVAAATTVVASTSGEGAYEYFLEKFRTTDNPQDQLRYLYALTDFDSPELVLRTCNYAVSGEVKSQNAPFVLARCIALRENGVLAWNFIRQYWEQAQQKFPTNTIVRMIDPVKFLNTPDLEADVRSFFSEHGIPQATKTLQQVLERQRVNTALRSREEMRLNAAL